MILATAADIEVIKDDPAKKNAQPYWYSKRIGISGLFSSYITFLPFKEERDISHSRRHRSYKGRTSEEEGPAILVFETNWNFRILRFLDMSNFVVDCRDVEDDA